MGTLASPSPPHTPHAHDPPFPRSRCLVVPVSSSGSQEFGPPPPPPSEPSGVAAAPALPLSPPHSARPRFGSPAPSLCPLGNPASSSQSWPVLSSPRVPGNYQLLMERSRSGGDSVPDSVETCPHDPVTSLCPRLSSESKGARSGGSWGPSRPLERGQQVDVGGPGQGVCWGAPHLCSGPSAWLPFTFSP